MIIEYDVTVSDMLRPVLEPKFASVGHLFPGWCEKLVVCWGAGEADNVLLTCDPKHEYRTMSVTVYPLFLANDRNWRSDLIHEIQHGILRPYVAKVDRIVEKFIKDDLMSEFILDDLAEAEEAVCEDLAIFAAKLEKDADV